MVRPPRSRPRPARRRRLRWLCAGTVLASALALTALVAWRVAVHAVPGIAVRAFERALDDDPNWEGRIDALELDLWRATGVVRGLEVRATSDQKVLRSVEIPLGHLRWSWRSVLRGRLHVDLVGLSPTVVARARPERLAPAELRVPGPGWFRFEIDTAIVDGTWVWRDLEREPEVRLALHPVNGAYEHLGTAPGPGRLSLVAAAPHSGLVAVEARLDLWNAHGEAVDLAMRLHALRPAAFQGADRSYAGIRLADGRVDAEVDVTWDAGRQELDGPPYAAGTVDDLRRGRIRVWLEGRGLLLADPPIARVALGGLLLAADGPAVGDEPYRVAAIGDGLDLHLRRADLRTLADLPGTGRATLADTLRRLPAFRLPMVRVTGVGLRFTDDAVPGGVDLRATDLDLEVRRFDNVTDADLPAEISLHGGVADGVLATEGTVEPLVWPPRFDVEADLRDLSLVHPPIARALRGYAGVRVEHGTLSARVTARSDGTDLVADADVEGRDLRAVSRGWRVGARRVDLAVAEGIGHALDLRADPVRVSALAHLRAPEVDVAWDARRLADRGELVATVRAREPLVVARRTPAGSGRGPTRGRARWTLDLEARDGRLVWLDPTTTPAIGLVMDPFDARIRRLGTMHDRARWEVSGSLTRGGTVSGWSEFDALGGPGSRGPMRMAVRASGLPLGALRDVTAAYLGLELAEGAADARLALGPRGGWLEVDGVGLVLADPPVEAVQAGRVRATLRWDDTVGPGSRVLTGAADRVAVVAGPMPDPIGALLASLPTLRVPWFDVTDSRLVVRPDARGVREDLAVTGVRLAIRDLATGEGYGRAGVAHGVVHGAGDFGGGRVRFEARAGEAGATTVRIGAAGLSLPALDPWLRAATGVDAAAGRVDVAGHLSVAADGGLGGRVAARVTGADLLQADDLREGLGTWLKSAVAGAAIDVIERDGTARIVVPVRGSAAAPEVRVGRAVLRALLVRLGLARPEPAVTPPAEVPPPMGRPEPAVTDAAAPDPRR